MCRINIVAAAEKVGERVKSLLGIELSVSGSSDFKYAFPRATWERAIAIVGLVLLITAVVSFWPLYAVLGINTSCKRNA